MAACGLAQTWQRRVGEGSRGSGALLLSLCVAMTAVGAPSSEDLLELDLDAAPLSATLIEIARQAGMIVSFRPEIVASQQAPPVRGRLTLIQALSLATQPSGLVVELTAAGTVSITPPPQASALPASAPAAANSAVAISPSSPMAQLPRVEILGTPRQSDGLRALRSWSATRMDVPIEDLPQQVSVLTQEALALQSSAGSTDAARFVTGVVLSRGIVNGSQGPGGDDGNILSAIQVRGLNASVSLSGMRTVRNLVPIDNAFIERIEVVKGPTGVISGVSDYGGRGGQVNLTRKQAGADTRTELSQSYSLQDGGTLRLGADVGGALTETPGTYWRLIGYGSQSGRTEGGFTRQYSTGVLASMVHRDGDFTAGLTMQMDRQRFVPAPSARGGLQLADGSFTPIEAGLVEPLDASDRALVTTADVELNMGWRPATAWALTGKVRLEGVSADTRRNSPAIQDDRRLLQPGNVILQTGAEHRFATGPVGHQTFVGLDLERWRFRQIFRGSDGDADLEVHQYEYRQALTLQDMMSAGPWRVRLAVQRGRIPERVRVGLRDRKSEAVPANNWDAGVLYRWSPTVSVYAGSQYGIETDNRRAGLQLEDGTEPARTTLRQSQIGLKNELLEGRLALSVEAYRLREKNRLLGDANGVLITPPGTSVDGLELELNGRPHPSVDLYLGLAFAKGISQGNIPLGWVPARSLRLLTRYRLPDSMMPNTSLGLAAMANSSTRLYGLDGDPNNPFLLLPGSARMDVSMERRWGAWAFTALLSNIFDRQFYGTVSDPLTVPVMPGRSLTLSATFRD